MIFGGGFEISAESAIATLRPQQRRNYFVDKKILRAAGACGHARRQIQRVGVSPGNGCCVNFQVAARKAAYEKFEYGGGFCKMQRVFFLGLRGKGGIIPEDFSALMQPFAVVTIHCLNDPRFGGAGIERCHCAGCGGGELVGQFVVGAGDDFNPMQCERLLLALEWRKRRRQRFRRAA